ncbi:M3 family metallopeptidase [Aquabacterium sp. OR-4]|uniref:M3 family metallopeptidase n=1 Tax=Aquabacterium sp. OR-4 TaxID=2978127 RepID=UPI0021B2AD01|nr:M3 family metallopeptidase [Aquabacterium sp. OR-4]MDT7835680.1 M3 family metallopeptidase [Aquabacterium sp. OR-4]
MDAITNPLLLDADQALALPAFDRIRAEHFGPAFERAMALHRAEIAAIVAHGAPPDFDNTVAAFDRAGALLNRVEAVFSNLTASATTPELQAAQRQLAGPVAAHWSAVHQDLAMFARIDAVHAGLQGGSGAGALTPEQRRLVERLHRDFQRAGAQLPDAARAEFAALAQQHAQLTTRFGQNVLHDEANFTLPLPDEAAMAGLPAFVRAAARQAAAERGLEVPVITLSRSLIVPFLGYSERRDLRETAWRAWVGRGEQPGEHDNRALVRDILALRRRQAALMGCANYADFKLADTMAQTRQRVWALLDEVWQRAVPALARERELLAAAMAQAGVSHALEAWDWRFWAERVRQQHYALDDAQLKPYFALPNMVAAAFECAQRLFGIVLRRRADLQAYHPDVDVYEVLPEAGGAPMGLFLHDNFSRPAKRSGAWMSSLAVQHRNGDAPGGVVAPVVLNNNNFAKSAPGQPTLLSPEDVRTLFHEFGHALHGLLSDVGYRRVSGTRVLRDFVELPSQLFEHWGTEREVLRRHARHCQTGEALPDALIDRLEAAGRFGQGYETVRYTASAIVDLAAHEQGEGDAPISDIVAFEQQVMQARGLPAAAGLNHRLPHFQHLFSGDSYAAGYYVYLWAEVLEADAFDAFTEAGSAFDAATAARLKACIYSRGDSVEPGAAFRAFRGRDAVIEPMLRGRGLI